MNRVRHAAATRARSARGILGAALVTTALAGCDETFVPLQPSETELSIFGYLDASADTQWVRVTQIRPLATTTRTPFDGRVSAEHLGNGQVLEFRDSLIRYRTADVGGEGVYLNNFWMAEPIEPGATYRLSVAREGKPTAEAVIEIPPEFEIEVAIAQHVVDTTSVILEGVRHIAFVDLLHDLEDDCGRWIQRDRLRQILSDGDVQRVLIESRGPAARGCGLARLWSRNIWIAASGAEWPTGVDYLTGRLSVPDGLSNISHSLGFVGGVLTRTIPYESCTLLSRPFGSSLPDAIPRGEHCRLRFDESRATLRGVTLDTGCPGRPPIYRLAVTLEVMEPGRNGFRKLRSATTDPSGGFAFHSLQPGTRHFLTVRNHRILFADEARYVAHEDTLELTAGETGAIEVEMQRLTPC